MGTRSALGLINTSCLFSDHTHHISNGKNFDLGSAFLTTVVPAVSQLYPMHFVPVIVTLGWLFESLARAPKQHDST